MIFHDDWIETLNTLTPEIGNIVPFSELYCCLFSDRRRAGTGRNGVFPLDSIP